MSKKQFILSAIIAISVCVGSFLFDYYIWEDSLEIIIPIHILMILGSFSIIYIVHENKTEKRKKQTKLLSFKGTIIIGDPCEMVKNETDWEKSEYGEKLNIIGFKNYISFEFEEDVPSVINYDKNEKIGSFCTDSCMVCIVSLDELLKYNPDFNQHLEYPENWMVIKDFDGIVIIRNENDYPKIIGKGNINFYTEQTIDVDELFENNNINLEQKKNVEKEIKYYSEKGYEVFNKLIEFLEIFNDTKIKTPVRYLNNIKYFEYNSPYKEYVESENNFASKCAIDGINKEIVEYYEKIIGEKLAPIGVNGFHYIYFISESGNIYAGFDNSLFYLGENYLELFRNLCDGPKLKEIEK